MARKTKQDALKTREALLNAAEKIFVAKGAIALRQFDYTYEEV